MLLGATFSFSQVLLEVLQKPAKLAQPETTGGHGCYVYAGKQQFHNNASTSLNFSLEAHSSNLNLLEIGNTTILDSPHCIDSSHLHFLKCSLFSMQSHSLRENNENIRKFLGGGGRCWCPPNRIVFQIPFSHLVLYQFYPSHISSTTLIMFKFS